MDIGEIRDSEIDERVYDSLAGNLLPEYSLSWVEDIYVPGHPFYEAYSTMWDAYDRLRDRLGAVDEDEDVEIVISSLLKYGKIAAMEMFRYGRKYQKMQDFAEQARQSPPAR